MAEKTSSGLMTATVATVVGGLILAAVLTFIPPAWAWLKNLANSIYEHLAGPATVSTWWLYVLTLSGIWILLKTAIFLIKAAHPHSTLATVNEPTWTDYTADEFFGSLWRWRYQNNSIVGLSAFCPLCKTRLVYSEVDNYVHLKTILHCETCQIDRTSQEGNRRYLMGMVERQIERKANTGEWKNYVERQPPAIP